MVPLDALFGNPDRIAPRLSPGGTRLGVHGGSHGRFDVRWKLAKTPDLFAVAKFSAPLMIVQGRTVEFLEFDDEGHGFAKPENRLRFYAAAEKFLARHLGGRCA